MGDDVHKRGDWRRLHVQVESPRLSDAQNCAFVAAPLDVVGRAAEGEHLLVVVPLITLTRQRSGVSVHLRTARARVCVQVGAGSHLQGELRADDQVEVTRLAPLGGNVRSPGIPHTCVVTEREAAHGEHGE
jgi:hypothetical protein